MRATANRGRRRAAVLACAFLLVFDFLLGSPVLADPVLTLLVGQQLDGSHRFAQDMARMWETNHRPTPERLAVAVEKSTRARLRALERGRADLAIVSAEQAASLLDDYPRVAVVAALWPVYLHALTRNREVQSLSLPLKPEIWITRNANYAYHSITELSGETGRRNRRQERNGGDGETGGQDEPDRVSASVKGLDLFPTAWLRDLIYQVQDQVLLFSAPLPLEEVTREMTVDSRLRAVALSPSLLEELRLGNPWMITVAPGALAYPRQNQKMEWPARYMVMISNLALPENSIRKVLQTLYARGDAADLFNPLFGQIDRKTNEMLSAILPYHPAAGRLLGLKDTGKPDEARARRRN